MRQQGLGRDHTDHQGDDPVAPQRVGQAGDGDIADPGKGGQAGFDIERVNIAAAADQHVVGATDDGQPAFVVEVAEIAGAQPAVGIGAAAVEVAEHDLRPAQADATIAGDADFAAGQRPPDQPLLPRTIGRLPAGDLRRRLAHAVTRCQRPAGGRRPRVQGLRQRGAADQHVAQAGRRTGAGIEQQGEHGGDQRQMADRVTRQVGGHPFGGKAVVEQDAGASPGAAPEDGLAADMVERQAVQPQIAGAERQALVGGGRRGIEIGGAQQHGARPAFAAAGRDDQCGGGGQLSRRRIVARPAVDRPERTILQAGDTGQAGQFEAAAGGA